MGFIRKILIALGLKSQHPGRESKASTHIILFLFTFLTCVIAGAAWAGANVFEITTWGEGLLYAVLILTFLSAHEFGHYFAAKAHGVKASLPFFIPFPPLYYIFPINFGTFGAVIKTRSPIPSRKALFDIGAAGPIAGFIVCIIFLIIGLQTLPGIDFIYSIHPEYLENGGKIPETSLFFGDTLLYTIFAKLFANHDGFLPPMNEIYHYPFLNVGWFGLFVTTLNMLPFGQLDGGHILYSMFGKKQKKIAKILWIVMIAIGSGSIINELYLFLGSTFESSTAQFIQSIFYPPLDMLHDIIPWYFQGWGGWLFWGLIAKFFLKLPHPPVGDYDDIGATRKTIGWATIIILGLSFSYNGIYFIM